MPLLLQDSAMQEQVAVLCAVWHIGVLPLMECRQVFIAGDAPQGCMKA